jgi:hypothetical protein
MKPQIGMVPGGIDLTRSVGIEYLCLELTASFGLPSASVAIEEFRDKPGTRRICSRAAMTRMATGGCS